MHFTDKLPFVNRLDIALITLAKAFTFSGYVNPVCLPLPSNNIKFNAFDEKWDEELLTISGFGFMDDSKTEPDKMLYANVVKQNADQCYNDWPKRSEPSDLTQMKSDGFCFKGKNGEVNSFLG